MTCPKCKKERQPHEVSKQGCIYCDPWGTHIHSELVELKPYDFPISKILEDDMEKLGVDTGDNPGEKIANATGKCPRCGAELDKDAPVPKCPVHGTEPFERKDP